MAADGTFRLSRTRLGEAARALARHPARWDAAGAAGFTAVALLLYAVAPLAYRAASDGHYSWIYARSLAYDGDLDFANDYGVCGDPFDVGWTTATHHRANFFYFGPAVFWTPAIWILKHFVSGSAEVRAGCVGPIPRLVLAMSCFAGGAVVLFSSALLRRWLSAPVAALATLLVALGSPLLALASTQPSYSHVYDALGVAAFLYGLVRIRERPEATVRSLALCGLLLGLAILQRSSNVVFGLVALLALVRLRPVDSLRPSLRSLAIISGFALLSGVLPLLFINHAIYGRAILYAHGPHFLWPGHAHPLLLLFDERGGVFPLAPVLWLGVPGLVMLTWCRPVDPMVAGLLACAAFELFLSSAAMDWQGARRMTNLVPLGALCVGVVVERCASLFRQRPRAATLTLSGVALLGVAFSNGAVLFGLSRGKIPFGRPLAVSERYGEGQTQAIAALESRVGPLTELPASWLFALRYGLSPIAFGWAAHPQWYQRDLHTLEYLSSDFPFAAPETRALQEGLKVEDGKRGACFEATQAKVVFSLQWPVTTRVRLTYDATAPASLTVRSRAFFGAARVWETALALPPGRAQKAWLHVPPGGLDSGIDQVELERSGAGDLCLLDFEFVDDTHYDAAPEALASPPLHMWRALEAHPDDAAAPSVAAGHGPGGSWIVEVHEAPGARVESCVEASAAGRVDALVDARGFRPRVAADPSGGWLVEVQQAQRDFGTVESRSGRIAMQDGRVSVAWTERVPYGAGLHPAVAAGAGRVLEIHERDLTGVLETRTAVFASGKLTWGESRSLGLSGAQPTIAMTESDGRLVVAEAHQVEPRFGPLWLTFGRLDADGNVVWLEGHPYDTGAFPALAIRGQTILEVHQGQDAWGPVWVKQGTFDAAGSVVWRSSRKYDEGGHPALALDPTTGLGLELHEGRAGLGPLWSHDLDVY